MGNCLLSFIIVKFVILAMLDQKENIPIPFADDLSHETYIHRYESSSMLQLDAHFKELIKIINTKHIKKKKISKMNIYLNVWHYTYYTC